MQVRGWEREGLVAPKNKCRCGPRTGGGSLRHLRGGEAWRHAEERSAQVQSHGVGQNAAVRTPAAAAPTVCS